MQRLFLSFFSLALTLATLVARASGDARAIELLAQARAALGGDSRLSKVQALSATGRYRREVGDRQIDGELTIDLQLPDKMLRTETMSPFGDATVVVLQGINGDRVLRNSRTIGGGPGMVVRIQPPGGGEAEAQALRNQRAELARFALAMLLRASEVVPVEFAYGGEAEADDATADVVDAKGAGNFATRLFIDRKTHRPLMLSYRGVAPRIVMQTQRGERPPDGGRGQPPADPGSAAHLPAPQIVDITMFLDEYRAIDGVLFPHHISRSIDGKPNEEWTFTTIKVNPAFNADAFSGK
jgi:hypothetical protein